MNYNWETIVDYGQYENGFVEVFKTIIDHNKVYAIVNYLPQFEDQDQKVTITILLEGEKLIWTKGKVKNILYDCEERVREVSNFKFRVFNRLEYMTIQTFHIKEMIDLSFGTNGTFSFEIPIN